jgi:hypothetical protein
LTDIRADAWLAWHGRVLADLEHMARSNTIKSWPLRDFLLRHYAANEPCVITLPAWPGTRDWTMAALLKRIGGDTVIEAQANRASDPDCDIRPPIFHRRDMPFSEFIDRIVTGPDGDIYITAKNNSPTNWPALAPLRAEYSPLPDMIREAQPWGNFWIGGKTMTHLHCDPWNTLLAQIMGRKHVRLISPQQVGLLGARNGTFSELSWVSDEIAAERGISVQDYVLSPGEALFIPVGWWHAIRALEPSVSVSFMTFLWHNMWYDTFPQ